MHWKTKTGILFSLLTIFFTQDMLCQKEWSDSIVVEGERFTLEKMYRNNAKEDLANGDTLMIRFGLTLFTSELNDLAEKYGFRFLGICTGSAKGYGYYNDEVIKSLAKRNGVNWWENFLKEESKLKIDSIKPLPMRKTN